MILTGKAKEDYKYSIGEGNFAYRMGLPDTLRNALIIEWFDSVKYNEIWSLYDFCFRSIFYSNNLLSILEIQTKAIIKANEIYNENIQTK